MNEDAKKKLKEKLGAGVTDAELENVAGGTNEENMKLLDALEKLDPDGVKAIYDKAMNPYNTMRRVEGIVTDGVYNLIKKHFGNKIAVFNSAGSTNVYFKNNDNISHAQMIDMINKKAANNAG